MAQAFKEITVWDDGNTKINHTYYLEGDKAVAYLRQGTTEPHWFKNPIQIDKRGRKFEQVSNDPFTSLNAMIEQLAPTDDIIEVQGSKGQTYFVNKTEKTCTCSGFTFRGTCKHVKEIEAVA